jgi:hypothetical protein
VGACLGHCCLCQSLPRQRHGLAGNPRLAANRPSASRYASIPSPNLPCLEVETRMYPNSVLRAIGALLTSRYDQRATPPQNELRPQAVSHFHFGGDYFAVLRPAQKTRLQASKAGGGSITMLSVPRQRWTTSHVEAGIIIRRPRPFLRGDHARFARWGAGEFLWRRRATTVHAISWQHRATTLGDTFSVCSAGRTPERGGLSSRLCCSRRRGLFGCRVECDASR